MLIGSRPSGPGVDDESRPNPPPGWDMKIRDRHFNSSFIEATPKRRSGRQPQQVRVHPLDPDHLAAMKYTNPSLPAESWKESDDGLASIPLALSNQYPGPIDEIGKGAGSPSDPRRHPGRRPGPHRRTGVRLGLVPERLADRPGGTRCFANQA